MDTYIVRVYRRGDDEDRSINGIVEEVGLDAKKAFSTVDELWMMLNADKKDSPEALSPRSRLRGQ